MDRQNDGSQAKMQNVFIKNKLFLKQSAERNFKIEVQFLGVV